MAFEETLVRLHSRIEAESAMFKLMQAVQAYHTEAGVLPTIKPTIPDSSRVQLRKNLEEEEHLETMKALEEGNLEEIADGLADKIWVCIGTALEYGIPLHKIFGEVMRINMIRVDYGTKREDGKITKPADCPKPDIAKILEFYK
jgi:predicted HAD superfamily Cof-like phosphohydrolase